MNDTDKEIELITKLCDECLSINESFDIDASSTFQAHVTCTVSTALWATDIEYTSDWHPTRLEALTDLKNRVDEA